MTNKRLLAAAAAFFAAAPAAATTLQYDGDVVTGVTGVSYGPRLYDVAFRSGSCVTVFGGCDSGSDFAFRDSASLLDAMTALRDQAFPTGYETHKIEGCTVASGVCSIFAPYELRSATHVYIHYLTVEPGFTVLSPLLYKTWAPKSFDYGVVTGANVTWAVWSAPTSPVPLPPAAALLLASLGGLAFLGAHRPRRTQEA